ncbi:hypothetical protein [Aquimarina agarilytica]|uniref:hypothetical protein n=1 Tax=Aquimarina agarilytica TaxID=1087449 RepID=UPI0002890F2E|nr:hypothetical protein [Aquimarina agarilytica]
MKNYITSVLLCLISFFTVIAQDANIPNDIGERLPGFVITKKGEKIEGFIKRKGKIASQRTVKFYTKKEDKKPTKYGPKDLNAYKILNDYYESIPYEGLTGKTKVFIHQSVQGKINLFEYFQYVTEDLAQATVAKKGNTEVAIDIDGKRLQTEIIAIKETGEVLKFASPKMILGFKKVVSNYMKDYPELATKIKNKEKGYGMLSILKIVYEYNANFK